MRKNLITISSLLAFITSSSLSFSLDNYFSSDIHYLNEILFFKKTNSFDIKILSDPYISLHQFELSKPNRFVLDLHGIDNIKSERQYGIEHPEIKLIRTGMFKSDTARVVIDLKGKIPEYKVIEIKEGIKVIFPSKKPIPKQAEKKEEEKKDTEKDKIRNTISKQQKEDIKDLEQKIQEKTSAINTELKETKALLDETLAILKEMQEQRKMERKKFLRIEALVSFFQFSDEKLRDNYKNAFMEGAEINIGIGNSVEFWAAIKNLTKLSLDQEQGIDRKIKIIPLEAGLKVRFNKGTINPYIGLGLGYHQYRETQQSDEIKKEKVGLIGQAGFFLKAAENLVFDIYANYRYCPIQSEFEELDIGGIHIGLGFGFEF